MFHKKYESRKPKPDEIIYIKKAMKEKRKLKKRHEAQAEVERSQRVEPQIVECLQIRVEASVTINDLNALRNDFLEFKMASKASQTETQENFEMVIYLFQANINALESLKVKHASSPLEKKRENNAKEKEDEMTIEMAKEVLKTYKELMETNSSDSEHANDPSPAKIVEMGNEETKVQIDALVYGPAPPKVVQLDDLEDEVEGSTNQLAIALYQPIQ